MKFSMFKVSRYWNKFAYLFISMGGRLIWDYTGKNKDILGEYISSETTKEIMTFTGK